VKSFIFGLFLLASPAVATAGSAKPIFRGEISDTQCAMNVHSLNRSHQEMISKNTMGTDPASCAKACVRRGGDWVLRSGKDIYRLKNQSGIENFAGRMVQITGTLDGKTNTVDNTGIEFATSKGTSH
jgi:hypothetical protein